MSKHSRQKPNNYLPSRNPYPKLYNYSDNGVEFKNGLINEFLELHQVKKSS